MEGGIVTLNSDRLAQRARILRAHGWIRNAEVGHDSDLDPRYTFVDMGFNLRPTELQGGFGIHQIKKLPSFNKQRDFLFGKFNKFVETTDYISTPKTCGTPSWLGIPLMVSNDAPFNRKEIVEYLENNGVETRPMVAGNITKQPVMSKIKLYYDEPLCGADEIHQRGFYMGLSPMFSEEKIDKLISLVNKFLKIQGKNEKI